MSRAESVFDVLRRQQRRLVTEFEHLDDSTHFREAPWTLDHLGRGTCLVLEGGTVFERAGVNVSLVSGPMCPPSIVTDRPELAGRPFTATGLSMVLHARNPYVPAIHANVRYFEVDDTWWFGGGIDLTPSYGFDEDAIHFHRTLRDCCDRHDPAFYPPFKQRCDEYFQLPHRGHMRGIGGIFFDRLSAVDGIAWAETLAFTTDALASIPEAYLPIVRRRNEFRYGDRQRDWQLLRRGRYAEFNLVYDRGTLFGLQTNGNAEAILMSLPPLTRWAFEPEIQPGSPESELDRFLQPQDWADLAVTNPSRPERRTTS